MAQMQKNLAIFSGSVNPEFAERVAAELKTTLGNVKLEKFKNGEIYARYNESVRGADVFLIQSVAGAHVNDALMELLIMADAARRASARDITAVITHYGYARQDRKAAAREPITAKLVANLIEVAGVDLPEGHEGVLFEGDGGHLPEGCKDACSRLRFTARAA